MFMMGREGSRAVALRMEDEPKDVVSSVVVN